MNIKQINDSEPVQVDISEWNDDVQAFAKRLTGLEQLVFNDYFLVFQDKDAPLEERFDAGFNAALLLLVNADGEPLLTNEDREAVKGGSAVPFLRVFTAGLGGSNETAKKN